MTKVRDIVSALEEYAPYRYAAEWDNCGLLVGRGAAEIDKAVVALDITADVLDEAKRCGAGMIISHHPVFFTLSKITDESYEGRLALALIESGVAACCMHTNLDAAERGVNYYLMRALGMPEPYIPYSIIATGSEGEDIGEGLISRLPQPRDINVFAEEVKLRLDCRSVRYAGSCPVGTVAVCSGGGGGFFKKAVAAGCDTFITGECKHNHFLEAGEAGVNLIEAGHFRTEDVVCKPLAEYLSEAIPGVKFIKSEICKEPFICL